MTTAPQRPSARDVDQIRRATVCPLDCPDSCSLVATVEGDRVIALDGSDRNPATADYICAKVRRYPELVHGAGRLTRPAIRVGAKGEGHFEPTTWDDALQRIATQMQACRARRGGESILQVSYGGSNGYLTQGTNDERLWRMLGASRLARTVCAVTSSRASQGLYGKMPGVAYADYEKAELIVVWGANPAASGIHLVPFIRRARRAGTRLVVIDPRRTPLAAQADLHLAIRPGTDLPVALAVSRWLFDNDRADTRFLDEHAAEVDEFRARAGRWSIDDAAREAGIESQDLERFATMYADADPAVLRCGWGPERNRNGGSATAAILALPAVAGKFGKRGGGYTLSNSSAWQIDGESVIGTPEPATRGINMNRVGHELLHADPAIDLLFVYNCNPLATLPAQEKVRAGLAREDLFTVVFDAVHTDTADYADIVLPATTFLEHSDLARGYGTYAMQRVEPVIAPVGEARPNYAVFGELLERLGFGDAPPRESWPATLLGDSADADRIRAELEADGIARPACGDTPVQFGNVEPRTADGKVHLVAGELDEEAPRGLYHYEPDPGSSQYPLALISPSTNRTVNSTLGHLHDQPAAVCIHPDDAASRAIRDAAEVRVFNELGEVHCRAALTADVRPGTVSMDKGLWARHTDNGATANALAPDTLNDLGRGACFNDARVQIEPRG